MESHYDTDRTLAPIHRDDLIARSGGPTVFNKCDEKLLQLVADFIVHLSDCYGTDPYWVHWSLRKEYPDLASQWG